MSYIKVKSNKRYINSSEKHSTRTWSTLKPPRNIINFFNEFNIFFLTKRKTLKIPLPASIITWMKSLNNQNHKDVLTLFPIKTCSLPINIEDYMINKTKIDFDVTSVSESRIKKNKSLISSRTYGNEEQPKTT